MYLSLGSGFVINDRDVVAVMDIDGTTVSKKTRDYLYRAQSEGRVEYTSRQIPKSFVIKGDGGVIISQLSPVTIKNRRLLQPLTPPARYQG